MKTPANYQPLTPQAFRDQATGIANTVAGSRAQGASRAARVVECMPAKVKRAVAPAQGYPTRG